MRTAHNSVRDTATGIFQPSGLASANALVSEKQMVQEKTIKTRAMQNMRMRVMNYLSQENFWASEIAGQDEVNTNEFVRRIITMG